MMTLKIKCVRSCSKMLDIVHIKEKYKLSTFYLKVKLFLSHPWLFFRVQVLSLAT